MHVRIDLVNGTCYTHTVDEFKYEIQWFDYGIVIKIANDPTSYTYPYSNIVRVSTTYVDDDA
jgi:hypothetical protein